MQLPARRRAKPDGFHPASAQRRRRGSYCLQRRHGAGRDRSTESRGFFADDASYIPVVGVDATKVGVEAIKDGTMLCTALNNPVILGNSVYNLMKLLSEGKELTQDNLGMDGVTVEGHHTSTSTMSVSPRTTWTTPLIDPQ